MKRTFLLLIVFCFTISFVANANTRQEVIRALEALERNIKAAQNEGEVRAALRIFRAQEENKDVLMYIARIDLSGKFKSSCACCPSCHNPQSRNPCDVTCPSCECPWPGTFTRRCVAKTDGRYDERDVYLCCLENTLETECGCAFVLMPCVEFCGYGYRTLSYSFNVAKVGVGTLINLIAKMFPCFSRTQEHGDATKEEILADLQGWITHLKGLSDQAPAYDGAGIWVQPSAPPHEEKE